MDDERPTRVGIGIIGRGGRYLIRRRPEGGPMPGVWEFPGGKSEPGESPEEATGRECREEIGVDVVVGRLLRRVVHRYPHGLVELFYHEAILEPADAEPAPDSGFVWVDGPDLSDHRFPEANEAMIAELARPRPTSP